MKHPVTLLKLGGNGIIRQFTDEQSASKLMSMGVLPGSSLRVVRIAPFSGGYYLRVDGINLVLRQEEAEGIIVEPAEPSLASL